MVRVAEVRYLREFRLWVRFDTGESGEVDLADLIARYAAAAPLRDPERFAKFSLDEWPTVVWDCGFDVSPETLYERATGKRPDWLQGAKAVTA